VVHHALCRVIEPIFEKRFIHDSYACRVGKGTHAALNRAQEFSKRYPYVLKCDLQHFFPSMDHQILRGQLAQLIADPQTMWLANQIIESGDGIHPDEDQTSEVSKTSEVLRAHGLPIGNLTSQFWANVYLNPLDQFVKRELKCEGYVRYVDDFLLFADDKRDLHRWKKAIIKFAASLRLKLHERESNVFPTITGIPFLGWRLYPDHRRLKRRNGVAFQRRFKCLLFSFAESKIKWKDVDASVQSWVAHAMHGQTYGLRRALLGGVVLPRVV
jgi:retron-type reverse transcriptase